MSATPDPDRAVLRAAYHAEVDTAEEDAAAARVAQFVADVHQRRDKQHNGG